MLENKKDNRIINFFKFTKYLKPYKKSMSLAIGSGVLHHLFAISTSAFCAYMVGLTAKGELNNNHKYFFTILAIIVTLRAIMYYSEMWFAHEAAYNILSDFRIKLYDAVERVSPAILLNMRSGELVSTLMSDVEVLEWFFAHTFGTALVAIIVPLIVLIYLGTINWILALIVLFFVIMVTLVPFFMQKKADIQGKDVRDKLANANADTVEGIQGLREILSLNYKKGYLSKIKNSMDLLGKSQVVYGKRLGVEGGIIEALMGFALVSTMALSSYLVYKGSIPFEFYTVSIILVVYIFAPVVQLSFMARNFGLILAASNRVFHVMEADALVEDEGKYFETKNIKPCIEFSDVGFKYNKNAPYAVKDISFSINAGESVALVGHSGAGKTTCSNLLLRLWDVNEGNIKIGDIDIRDMSLDTLRNMTSAVLQDVYLFNSSICENIRLGKPDATDEEVENAAKAALCHEFITGLPEGYDTITGERGIQLSGGQRQRISIARAILKDSPILILDEAVSNIDSENEKEIQKALNKLKKERTTLVIAHRLSTILSADRLIVLDKGTVVQSGSHSELINEEGVYRQIISSQYNV